MNTPRNRQQQPQHKAPVQQFAEDMPDPLAIVEHVTIPGFIRRCPHRFHISEITRYGDQVGKIAESMQISYLTTIDRSFGQIRLFPVPLLIRVYEVMSAQFGWEPWVDTAPIDDRKPGARINERTRTNLRAARERTDDPVIAEAMDKVLGWLEKNTETTEGAPAPTILRPV